MDGWDIINRAAGEKYGCSSLPDFFADSLRHDLVYFFARPVRCFTLGLPVEKNDRVDADTHCPILSIPNELLSLIFDELDCIDSLRLLLASQRFFQPGWKHVEQKMRLGYGRWAGDPVFCIAEFCDVEDMPPGFLTDEEKQMLNEGPDQRAFGPTGLTYLCEMAGLGLAEVCFMHPYDSINRWRPFRHYIKSSHWLSVAQKAFVEQQLDQQFFDYFPVTENWILRDLTSKEFVRGDGIFDAFQEPGLPVGLQVGHGRYPGFVDAIVSRICWALYSSAVPLPRMQNGPWAGHAFEICIESEHIAGSTEEWVDVTRAVVEDLALIHNLKIRDHNRKCKREEDDERTREG